MGKSLKIAWLSDLDLAGSGYKNVSVPLCRGLVERGHEILAIGLGYKGDQHDFPFGVLQAKSIREAEAMVINLQNMQGADVVVTALDIPLQERIMNSPYLRQRKLKYVGIFPVEADPICISWAMVLMQMDRQIVISQFGTNEARSVGVPADYVQIGIDIDAWPVPTEEQKFKLRGAFGFSRDDFVVLTVADNQERKNLAVALEAFGEFAKDKPNARYILVTREHNPVGWKLRDLGQEYGINSKLMIFERGMSHSDLWTTYAIADAFLLCSKAEGLGMPLLEAMAVGLPCVGTNCTGMRELLSNGRGYLVDFNYIHRDPFGNGRRYWVDRQGIIDTLNYLYYRNNEEDIAFTKTNARQFVEARTWQIAIDQVEKVLLEICK